MRRRGRRSQSPGTRTERKTQSDSIRRKTRSVCCLPRIYMLYVICYMLYLSLYLHLYLSLSIYIYTHIYTYIYVSMLPFWIALGEACGMAPALLRSEVISAAQASMAFFSVRALAEARKLSWCLGAGDKDKNLDNLAAGPMPAEPVSAKIWHLVRLGFNRTQLKQALDLLMDCPGGMASAEQQHASATTVKKLHPECGLGSRSVAKAAAEAKRHVLLHREPAWNDDSEQEQEYPEQCDLEERLRDVSSLLPSVNELASEVDRLLRMQSARGAGAGARPKSRRETCSTSTRQSRGSSSARRTRS